MELQAGLVHSILSFDLLERRFNVENFSVFDFELCPDDMEATVTLDTKKSSFFDHRDPAMVKMLGGVKLPV